MVAARKDTPEVDAAGELLLIDDPAAITWMVTKAPADRRHHRLALVPRWRGRLSLFFALGTDEIQTRSLELQMPLLIDLMRMAEADPSITGCTFHYAKGFSLKLTPPDAIDRPALWISLHRLYGLARRMPLPCGPAPTMCG